MANEIKIPFDSSFTLYATIRNLAGLVWYIVGQVFETWGTGGRDADDYDIALTSDNGEFHIGNFDTNVALGQYSVTAYINTGTPADGDDIAGAEDTWWTGSEEQTQTEFELNAYTAAKTSDVTGAHSITDGKIDAMQSDVTLIKAETDLLDGMIIEDSAGNQFTATALQNAPIFDHLANPVELRATGGVAGKNAEELIDDVWDEPLTGATHNVPTSAGRRLRQIDISITSDTAQGSGTGNNQIQLAASESAIDGTFDPTVIYIAEGTGAGQSRNIFQYDGTTKIATVDRNWKVNPASDSVYVILADAGREHVNEGLAQAGTSTTITLNTLGSASDNAYRNQIIFIRSGTGEDQVRRVIAYDGTTKIATISRAWETIPDSTSGYSMLPAACVEVQAIKDTELGNKVGANLDVFFQNGGNDTVDVVDNVGLIKVQTDLLSGMIIEDSAGNRFTVTALVNARGTNNANTVVPDAAGTAAGLHTTTDVLIGLLNDLSQAQAQTACDAAITANTDINSIQTVTDLLNNMIIAASGDDRFTAGALQNAPTAEMDAGELHAALDSYTNKDDYKLLAVDVVTALMADTGFTVGGTMNYEKLLKILAAWVSGNWRDKSGEDDIKELLDADDKATVILEMTLSKTTPARLITVQI